MAANECSVIRNGSGWLFLQQMVKPLLLLAVGSWPFSARSNSLLVVAHVALQ